MGPGSLCRITVPSLVYLVSFCIWAIWLPHALLPGRIKVVKALLWFLTCFTGLTCIGHIVFQALLLSKRNYGRDFLPDTGTSTEILMYFGFSRISNVGEGFRLLTADIVLFLASTAFTILLMKGIIFSSKYIAMVQENLPDYIPRHSSLFNSIIMVALLILNGLSYSSGLQAVYFVLFMALVVSKAFLRIRLGYAIRIMFYPLYIYNIAHIISTYIYQADVIRNYIPPTWSLTIGFRYYGSDIDQVPLIGASIIVSWVSSILLLVTMSIRMQNAALRSLTRVNRDYMSSSDTESNYSTRHRRPRSPSVTSQSKKFPPYWDRLRPYVREWGWRLSLIALLAIALFLPSFFSVVLLITVCVASIVPQVTMEKYLVVPGITLYLFIITTAQYIYNIPNIGIPCDESGQTALCALGFRTYQLTWFQIGLQSLACLLLGINWGFYEAGMDSKGVQLSESVATLKLGTSDEDDEPQRHSHNSGLTGGDDGIMSDDGDSGKPALPASGSAPTSIIKPSMIGTAMPSSSQPYSSSSADILAPPKLKHSSLPSEQTGARRRHHHHSHSHQRETSSSRSSKYNTLQSHQLIGEEQDVMIDPELELEQEQPGCCQECMSKCQRWWVDFRPVLKAIGFWALKQSYIVSLTGLYVAGLNRVNLLNTGYLLILILFLTSPRIARRFWLLLVLYCEFVILLVYTWSATPWTASLDAPKILPVIGLKHYKTTDLLFTQGLVWHLVIMLFSVLQLWALRYTDKIAEEGKDKPSEKIPRWMKSIGNMFFWAWDEYGLIPVYTVLIIVASIDGKISLINILYILLTFVCLTIHMITRKADVHIKRFWIFVVVASGLILLARYAYQFTFIQELLADVLPAPIILAFGFEIFHQGSEGQGAVFVPLLGNTFVLLVGVIQLQTFFAKKEPPQGVGHNPHARRMINGEGAEHQSAEDEALHSSLSGEEASELYSSGRSEKPFGGAEQLIMDEEGFEQDIKQHPLDTPAQRRSRISKKHPIETVIYNWALDIIYLFKRFCMLHSFKVAAFVMVILCLQSPSGLNSVYLEVCILSVAADHMTDGVGLLLLTYSQVIVLFTLIFQFEGVHNGLGPYWSLMTWGGIVYNPDKRLQLIGSKMGIIILLLIQRFSHRWKNDWYRLKKAEMTSMFDEANRNPSLAVEVTSRLIDRYPHSSMHSLERDQSLLLYTEEPEPHPHTRLGLIQQIRHLLREDTIDNEQVEALQKEYLHMVELTLFLYESPESLQMGNKFTFKEAWNFVAWMLSNALKIFGFPVLAGALLILIFVHKETVYGVIFLLILGVTCITSTHRWIYNTIPVKILMVYVGIEFLLQYVLNLNLPPPDLKYPWAGWDRNLVAWLGLQQSTYGSTSLLADFVLLLVVARIKRISLNELISIRAEPYWHYLIGPVLNFKHSRTWRDSVRYFVYRFGPFVILLLIFVAGTIKPNLLSLIYVIFALLFIFRESAIYSQRNKIWRWARMYNFLLIFVSLIYQIPFIDVESEKSPMSPAKIIGLQKFSEGGSILFSLLIFILLGIQKKMFSRREFDELVESILDEEERGVKLAQERFVEWKIERKEEFERVQEEKRKRRQQLDLLKAARQRQQRMWLNMAKEDAGSKSTTMMHHYGAAPATAPMPTTAPATVPAAMGTQTHVPIHVDYLQDPRMRTMTSRDLKMLQEQGDLQIQQDPTSHTFTMKFRGTPSRRSLLDAQSEQLMLKQQQQQEKPSTSEARHPPGYVSFDAGEPEPTEPVFMDQPSTSTTTGPAVPSESESEDSDVHRHADFKSDTGDEEVDVLAAQLTKQKEKAAEEASIALEGEKDEKEGCCQDCWRVPKFVHTIADVTIAWLDKQCHGYLTEKPHYGRLKKIWIGLYKLYQMHSHLLCYLIFMVNAVVNSDLISLFYPLSMFLYALLETPRPHKLYWNTVFVYAAVSIVVKFFFQFSMFCLCHSEKLHLSLASTCEIEPTCRANLGKTATNGFSFSAPRVIGITTYSKLQGGPGGSFLLHVIPDLLVLISIFLHRYWLKKHGYWSFVQRLTLTKGGDLGGPEQLKEEAIHFERVAIKQQKKRELWTRYAAEKKKKRLAKQEKIRGLQPIATFQYDGDVGEHARGTGGSMEDDDIEKPSEGRDQGRDSYPSEGLQVVSNPLFKVGESDFETDTEMAIPSLTQDSDKPGKGSGPASSKSSPMEVPKVQSSKLSSVLGSALHDQTMKRKKGDQQQDQRSGSTVAPGTSPSPSGLSDQIVLVDRGDEEDDDDGDDSSSSSGSGKGDDDIDDDLAILESVEDDGVEKPCSYHAKKAFYLVKRWLRNNWIDFKHFYSNVVTNKPGRELYVHMWFVELLCFFIIVLFPYPFIGNSSGNVASFLLESRLPNSYVLTLFVQFIFIIIERVLYLYRASKVKLAYHYILVLFYHGWLLFFLPTFTSTDFRSQPVLIAFYMLKLAYMCLSSLQIMYGYPAFVQGQFLTDSKEPGMIRNLIYTGYRAIPFVYELRTILDWTVTKTSLTFFEWLKCEDIYANLFLVKCRVSQDKVWERNVGDPQPWYIKLILGALLFAALAAVIWFPLLLLMQGSPGNQMNPITSASITIGFTGYASPIYTASSSGVSIKSRPLTQNQLATLRVNHPEITYDDFQLIQTIEFENFSDVGWFVSPPAKQHLMYDLAMQRSFMSVHMTFTRTYAINSGATADFPMEKELFSTTLRQEIIDAINGTASNFTVPKLFPRFFRIPNVGNAVSLNSNPVRDSEVDMTFVIVNTSQPPYWLSYNPPMNNPPPNAFPWDVSPKLQVVTFSAEAPKGIFKSLASVGLIGLYVGLVLAVARFLRMAITDLAFRIIYEDMPSCEELISYCEDIYLARQDGDLVLEEELFRELIELYRSPESIILRTLPSGPRFAGREGDTDEKKQSKSKHRHSKKVQVDDSKLKRD